MARKLFNPLMILHLTALAALIICLASARDSLRYTSDSDYHHDDDIICPDGCDCTESVVDCSGSHMSGGKSSKEEKFNSEQTIDRWYPSSKEKSECPTECSCYEDNVDCRDRGLASVPSNIPETVTELRLEQNQIKYLPGKVFSSLKHLRRLDLSNNQIRKIAGDAFHGLKSLTTLVLYGNRLTDLPRNLFHGLTSLQVLLLNANNISCIQKNLFADLHSLNLLSLYNNNVKSLANGTLDSLKEIKILHLGENPFVCDCNLKWLSAFLQKNPIETSDARCDEPKRNQRRRIISLDLTKLKCKDSLSDSGDHRCPDEIMRDEMEHEATTCPTGCSCTGSVVRCSGLKLAEFPKDIPLSVSELYLDVNDITSIPPEINRFTELTRLDLSNNRITVLPNFVFANLSRLDALILSYNKLRCIQQDSLRGLKSLRALSLHSNDISMIPEGVFKDLESATHIALGSNPLYCDCNLRWLAARFKKDYTDPGIARCAEPRSMANKILLTAPVHEFLCIDEPDPSVLAKCDVCYTFPCKNGGRCVTQSPSDFACDCAPGFYGVTCESRIDACFGNPCENAGTCKVLEAGRFKCHCPIGFEGDRCEVNIDECFGNRCGHNSTCVDKVAGYECKCQAGYTGQFCDVKMEFCSQQNNPCKNGANCNDHLTHYTCACPLGWTGDNCTVNVDDCVEILCQNGGTCVDGLNSYHCQCPDGFVGSFCEVSPLSELLNPQQTSPCQQHDCKHGVCFQPNGSSDYVCKCSPGFTGERCELLSSVSFHENAFLEFDPLKSQPSANITISFASSKQNGLILYAGESEHLAVELFRGRIRISLDVGNYPASTMFSYEVLADGKYHTVQLLLVKKNITMTVDSGMVRSIVNEGIQEYLDVNKPLYLGGLPEAVGLAAQKSYHIYNSTSFQGCMSKIFVNGNPLDIMVANKQQRVTPGCSEFYASDVCDNNQCQKGKCLAIDAVNYECKCKAGWSGKHCDTAPSCQKSVTKEHHEENGCRSVKRYKMSKCTGSCGSHCCKPLKTKKRSIKMVCPDGSTYTAKVEIIRKCGCSKKC